MLDLINEILQTLNHNKLRTALTGLAVAWGVFMLIVLLSVARGVTNNFQSFQEGAGSKVVQLWGGYTSKPYNGLREGRGVKLRDNDISRLERASGSHVGEVSSVIYGEAQTITAGTRSINGEYTGMYPSARETERHTVISGRYINQKDMDQCAHVMVLSEDFARQLFPPDGAKAVGSRVSCKGLSFLVIGVYKANWYRDNIIPYTTARHMAANPEEVGSLKIQLADVNSETDGETAESDIRRTVADAHNFDPEDESALFVNNRFLNGLKAQGAMNILSVSVWVLGLLSLLSGIVGISNIMFVSVKERTHEIGIRRAIGARPRSILVQIIAEAIAITTIFGYIGIVSGTAVTQVIGAVSKGSDALENPTVSLALAFEVTLVLVIAGAMAGLFPALKALKVKPVEALRDE